MRLLKRALATVFPALAGILLLSAAPAQAKDRDPADSKSVTVMTWNLFFGFDDGPVLAAAMSEDSELIIPAATEAWRQVHATDFHRRVRFTDADVVGNTVLDRALAGMWPSDHAGLVVTFVP